MRNYFLLRDEVEKIGTFKGMSGSIGMEACLPVHTLSEDGSFVVHANGSLFMLFSADGYRRQRLIKILDNMPEESGFQMYSYHGGGENRHYLCLSKKIDYRPRVGGFGNFLASFSNRQVVRELDLLTNATNQVEDSLDNLTDESVRGGYLKKLKTITPLVSLFAPVGMGQGGYSFKSEVAFNLSYLVMGEGRYGLLAEINSMQAVAEGGFFHPETDLEHLCYTCLRYPPEMESHALTAKNQRYLEFQTKFKADASGGDSFLTQELSETQVVKAFRANVIMTHFILFFSGSITRLRRAANEYIESLCHRGIPVCASMTKTKLHYCLLFPGNTEIRRTGSGIGTAVTPALVPSVLSRLHK